MTAPASAALAPIRLSAALRASRTDASEWFERGADAIGAAEVLRNAAPEGDTGD